MKTENKQPPAGCPLEPVPIGDTFYVTINFDELVKSITDG